MLAPATQKTGFTMSCLERAITAGTPAAIGWQPSRCDVPAMGRARRAGFGLPASSVAK